jgi:hypothetical protein
VRKIDLVTVCFSAELRLLALQARSLRLFLPPGLFGRIFIIVNDPDVKGFRREFETIVLPEYGVLGPRVHLVDFRDFWKGRAAGGWHQQQVLKLMIAGKTESAHYLVLDAKNHFVRQLRHEDLFAADGRMRSHMYRIHPSYRERFIAACRFFGGPRTPDLARGLPTATPFLMDRQIVQDLMAEVERRSAHPFHKAFMVYKFTEFYLYYAYVLARFGAADSLYEQRKTPTATLFSLNADKPDRCAEILHRLDHDHVYCMGTHRDILHKANPEVLELVFDAWQRKGLVSSREEARYFGQLPPPKKQKYRRLFFWR